MCRRALWLLVSGRGLRLPDSALRLPRKQFVPLHGQAALMSDIRTPLSPTPLKTTRQRPIT